MSDRVLTVEELLALHPWPAEYASQRRLEWLWHYDLAAPTDELWRITSDTSRMNRSLGISEMSFEDRGGVRYGRSRPGGVDHRWIEVPWNWVAGQWLEAIRLYQRGFMVATFAVQRFEPIAGGTRMYVYFGCVPRGFLSGLALRWGFPSVGRAYARLLPKIAEGISRRSQTALLLPPPRLGPGVDLRLEAIAKQLVAQGLDGDAVARLVEWIRTGDEQDLLRIQVRERARAWSIDEDQLLRVCLHGIRHGLLELSWDVVCPHCRAPVEETTSLSNIPAAGECEVCQIDFATDALESIEITFHVHPSIRDIPRRRFCSAEPSHKEHIRVQRLVAPGQATTVQPALTAGRWRIRLAGSKSHRFLDVAAAGASRVEWQASGTGDLACAPGAALTLGNDLATPQLFVLESSQWVDVALRPNRLLSFPDFRDLFSAEYLADTVQLAVGEQTILFTDVVGSTRMYLERGDSIAFLEVKRHFEVVFGAIRAHRGVVIKTIGDAAMGAFCDPVDALRCAAAIHRAFGAAAPVRVRISLHTGPCLAVKLNTEIDYFGSSVNLAAKLQVLAEAGEVAMSDRTAAAPGVAEYLASQRAVLEEVALTSPSFPQPVTAKRWSPSPS